MSLFISKKIMNVIFVVIVTVSITTTTPMSVKLYLTTLRHINQIRVTQVALNSQVESLQRKRKSAMASLFLYFATIVCCLPHICRLFIIAAISEPGVYVQYFRFYALTLGKASYEKYFQVYFSKTRLRFKARLALVAAMLVSDKTKNSAYGPYVSCSCHPFIVSNSALF